MSTITKLCISDITDVYKLRSWIDTDKLNWDTLSYNLNAIHLIEKIEIK